VTVRFLADEDLDADIIQGLRSREPAIDILDVKTAELRGTGDPELLELAAPRVDCVTSGRMAESDRVPAVPVRMAVLARPLARRSGKAS
jgi:hypothetical protein